jgi:Mor family transcriptional regulator
VITSWPELFTAAFSGGLFVKALNYFAEWIKSSYLSKKSAQEIVDKHLDPLLKAVDEIAGKTRALAVRDYKSISTATENKSDSTYSSEIVGLAYLYAQFWSRIEILKQESLGVSISSNKNGAILNEFLSCLESRLIRLVDRVHQKAIGEISTSMMENGKLRSIGLVEFDNKISSDPKISEWIRPLMDVIQNVHIKKYRQKVLVYGVVIHALIDTLDPNSHSSSLRPGYPNKLSKQSKHKIKNRAFGPYLKKVKNIRKYVGDI